MSTEEASRDELRAKDVTDRLPRDIIDALSEDQLVTLRQVITETRPWREHPVDVRASFQRLFITLVAGTNRRSPDRREQDRKIHPFRTRTNMVYLGAAVAVMYAIAAAITLALAQVVVAILEYFNFD